MHTSDDTQPAKEGGETEDARPAVSMRSVDDLVRENIELKTQLVLHD